jgi:hypothetical protein
MSVLLGLNIDQNRKGNPVGYGQKIRDEAETRFSRAQKAAEEGKKALKEHEAEAARVNANTARLRALRLAKEEADRANAAPKPKRRTAKKKAE